MSSVIPLAAGRSPREALSTLRDVRECLIVHDSNRGANWARNRGAELAQGEFLLFSDDDIRWKPRAVDLMRKTLRDYPNAAFCYGSYMMDGQLYCRERFNAKLLRERNYISTMSLIRSSAFPGFDESIRRLQDWDLWLTMLEHGHVGVHCGLVIFETTKHDGISFGPNAMPWEEADMIVRRKHGLA